MNAQTKVEAASLASAMAAAFGAIEGATKSANNPHFKSKYADLTGVIEAIKPALVANGLFFTQHPEPVQGGVQIKTFLHHAGGESLSLGSLFVPANKNDAQAFGSALTYARRYALVTAFGVPTEDDDGNAAAKSPPAQEQRQEPKQPQHSKLKTELRQFVHELEGCGDWETYCAFRDTAEFQRLTAECREKLPQYWDGSPDMPEEFVPLRRRIEILETNLGQQIADLARA